MDAYKLSNPHAKAAVNPSKNSKKAAIASVSTKKRKVIDSDDDGEEDDKEKKTNDDDDNDDDDDDDAQSKSASDTDSVQDRDGETSKKRMKPEVASQRPETDRVKAVRTKAAESVRANIFESKKAPSAPDKKETQVHPMRPNTVPKEELAQARIVPPITAPLPDDFIPSVGDKVVLIRQAYVEFVDTLPPRITKTLDKARANDSEDICDLPSTQITGDVRAVEKITTNLKVTLYHFPKSISCFNIHDIDNVRKLCTCSHCPCLNKHILCSLRLTRRLC